MRVVPLYATAKLVGVLLTENANVNVILIERPATVVKDGDVRVVLVGFANEACVDGYPPPGRVGDVKVLLPSAVIPPEDHIHPFQDGVSA
jgi:hypothetical protein